MDGGVAGNMSDLVNPIALLSLASLALLMGGALLVARGDGARQLRARVRLLRPTAAPSIALAPSIRVAAPDDLNWLQRMLRMLGYNPAIPRSHAMPLPMVLALAGGMGLAMQVRVQPILGGLVSGVMGVAVAVGLAMFIWRRQARRYREELFKQLPEVVGQVARALRAGLPVNDALRRTNHNLAPPSQGELAKVVGETTIGVPLETALWNLYLRVGLTEYSFLAITIALQAQTGGNLAESLDNVADMTRRRLFAAAKARALSAEAKTSAAILGALPFVCAFALLFVNPDYISILFNTALGNKLLLAFGCLLSAGLLTIRWLIKRSTQD